MAGCLGKVPPNVRCTQTQLLLITSATNQNFISVKILSKMRQTFLVVNSFKSSTTLFIGQKYLPVQIKIHIGFYNVHKLPYEHRLIIWERNWVTGGLSYEQSLTTESDIYHFILQLLYKITFLKIICLTFGDYC